MQSLLAQISLLADVRCDDLCFCFEITRIRISRGRSHSDDRHHHTELSDPPAHL